MIEKVKVLKKNKVGKNYFLRHLKYFLNLYCDWNKFFPLGGTRNKISTWEIRKTALFLSNPLDDAEAPIFWPPVAKNWLIGKGPDAERLRVRGEGGDRRWNGWMASLTGWTWIWASSETEKTGVLQFMGLQRLRHNLATEQQQQ